MPPQKVPVSAGLTRDQLTAMFSEASRCAPACDLTVAEDGQARLFGSVWKVLYAKHRGRLVRIDVDLPDVDMAHWKRAKRAWCALVAEDHREDVLVSDWPVF